MIVVYKIVSDMEEMKKEQSSNFFSAIGNGMHKVKLLHRFKMEENFSKNN